MIKAQVHAVFGRCPWQNLIIEKKKKYGKIIWQYIQNRGSRSLCQTHQPTSNSDGITNFPSMIAAMAHVYIQSEYSMKWHRITYSVYEDAMLLCLHLC